jgi:hypothetical protein
MGMKMKPESVLRKLASCSTLEALRDQVLTLQTADKFRLAAMLLDQNKHQLAEVVGERACQEIRLCTLLGRK